jgi:hypothetical protein
MGDRRHPCGGVHRRAFLAAGSALGAIPALLGGRVVSARQDEPAARPRGAPGALGLPGPYPGRVVEVRNPAMIREGKKDRDAIKAAVDRGMVGLTGADDAVEAWRTFFEPGDVVGIKMNPVGKPLANSSSELMLEVVEGLKAAGVKPRDIVVFERYRGEFIGAKMNAAVPDGIAWGGLTYGKDDGQLLLKWDGQDDVAGYDPDEFVEMELVGEGADPKDDRTRRSHLGLLVTRRVNKLVLLPVLKDHGSAGITGALKNMSHGLVNNVARSHSAAALNVCNQFIPEVVAHPIIRKKCVLQILDGIRGVFQKGPFGGEPKFVWDYNGLFFATDPVAMDRIEWDVVDAKRKAEGLPPVAATGRTGLDPLGTEGFDMRQPQHVPLCGTLGLGVADRKKIDHRVITIS